jgi:hypothetical protein
MKLILVAAVRAALADWQEDCEALKTCQPEDRGMILRSTVNSSKRLHAAWGNLWKQAPAYAAALAEEIHGRIA